MTCVLILDSNSSGNAVPAVREAHRRGLTARLFARNPDEYETRCPELLEVVDAIDAVDTMDAVQLSRAIDIVSEPCAAVMAFDELRIVQAAYAAVQLGVSHASVNAVARLRYKDRVRSALKDTEFDVQHGVIGRDTPLDTVDVGWPCIVKPLDEADSEGVTVCEDEADLSNAVAAVRCMEGTPNSRGYVRRGEALVEEFIHGPEFSAEMVWDSAEERFRLIGITSREFEPDDQIEQPQTGHVFPLPESIFPEDVEAFADRLLGRLGLDRSIAHVELRLDEDQRLRLLEVNPRAAGGHIGDLVQAVRGVHLAELQLAAQLGDAGELLDASSPDGAAGIVFLDPFLHYEIRTGRTIREVREQLAEVRRVDSTAAR